ncbi:MAG: hypothetical protein WC782_12820 [Methylococcaceae bacterium]|jgi:hypothetical protein
MKISGRLFAVLICIFTSHVFAEAVAIADINEKILGKSLGEYGNQWWQWASSMPALESPVKDKTGLKCNVNQNGQIWFLAGGYGSSKITRTCSIPRDKYLFFPVINMLYIPVGDADLSCKQAKALAALNNDNLRSFVVSIDQHTIVNPAFHRYSSPDCFDLLSRAPKSPQSLRLYPSATDGYWVMLKPLPVGQHTIKFKAEYHNPDEAYGMMVQDIEYQIEIVESIKAPPQLKLINENKTSLDNGV